MAKLRARYAVKGPKTEKVTYNKCSMNPETKSLEIKVVTEDMECYWIYFPMGHSIRVTSFDKLKEMGYHLKPRMVDMDTGDIIDIGGSPYDFADNIQDQHENEVILDDSEDEGPRAPKSKTKE